MLDGRDPNQPFWKSRRVLMPLGILLAALVVGLFATQQSRSELAAVEAHARELCRLVANGEDPAGAILVNDAALKSATAAAIRVGCAAAEPDLSNVEIEVMPGDMGNISSHGGMLTEATHQVRFTISDVTTLILRVSVSDHTMGRVVIMGYGIPGTGEGA